VTPYNSNFKRLTAFLAVVYGVFLISNLAGAQTTRLDAAKLAVEQPGLDYFTADLQPEVKAYLDQISNRHASERVWQLYRDGMFTEPLGDCKYALDRFPNHPRALYLLGEIAKATHETSMPIQYFERALKLFPQHAFTHAQYGHYLVEIGAASAGIAELVEAQRLDPNQLQAQAWLTEARSAGTEKEQPVARDQSGADQAGFNGNRPKGSRGN